MEQAFADKWNIRGKKKKGKQKTKYNASMGQFHLSVKYVNY